MSDLHEFVGKVDEASPREWDYLGLGPDGRLREPELNIDTVASALADIERGKRCQLKPVWQRGHSNLLHTSNWEECNGAPESAIRIITRALREGQEDLIKRALDLSVDSKAQILLRRLADRMHRLAPGSQPVTREDWLKCEFVPPSKQEVERALEERYPEIYAKLPKKDGKGGPRLHPKIWRGAGLKDKLSQARGYKPGS